MNICTYVIGIALQLGSSTYVSEPMVICMRLIATRVALVNAICCVVRRTQAWP